MGEGTDEGRGAIRGLRIRYMKNSSEKLSLPNNLCNVARLYCAAILNGYQDIPVTALVVQRHLLLAVVSWFARNLMQEICKFPLLIVL